MSLTTGARIVTSQIWRDLVFIGAIGGVIYYAGQVQRQVEIDAARVTAMEQHLAVISDRMYAAVERAGLLNARQDEQIISLDRRQAAIEVGYSAGREVLLNFQQRMSAMENQGTKIEKAVTDLQALTQHQIEMTTRLLDQNNNRGH